MKKKNMMVRYTLVPNSEDYNSTQVSRCQKLSKFKIVAILAIGIIALGFLLITFLHRSVWNFPSELTNLTGCLLPGEEGIDYTCMNKSGKTGGLEKSQHNSTGRRRCFKHGRCSDGSLNLHHLGLLKKRFPVVLIIGARKGGTRALIRFINLHRDVAASKKETHFFDRNYHKGFEWYLKQMPFSYPHQLTIEKTPNYFVDWNVPELVYSYNSSMKLLLILRNPIDRAVSDYIQLKEKEKHPELVPPFEELVIDQETGEINRSYAPIKRSLYCRHLDKWLAFFDMSQILIVDGENIKSHPWEEMYKVEKFLGLSHEITSKRFIFNETKGFYCVKMKKIDFLKMASYAKLPLQTVPPHQERCLSPSKGREHPPLDVRVQEKLEEFFKPFNRKLFSRIGRRFDWF